MILDFVVRIIITEVLILNPMPFLVQQSLSYDMITFLFVCLYLFCLFFFTSSKFIFLIEGYLLYRILLFFVKHQHESA